MARAGASGMDETKAIGYRRVRVGTDEIGRSRGGQSGEFNALAVDARS
jgi:hypothetical protein